MFRRFSVALAAMFCIAGAAHAQQPCASDKVYWETVKQHPEILQYEQRFEEQIAAAVAQSGFNKTTLSASDTTTFDVPLVIHVVHDYGVEYLSDDVIYNAVKYWAQIYVCGNTSDTANVIAPFKKYVGNARIRLHLATIDPTGKPTKGVVHHHSYLTGNADDQAKIGQWPQNKYINLWFINTFGAASTGAAAYAYYPSSAAFMPYYDGVIGLYTYINYDMAIPHEIGHVLNLQHTWGNTNNPDVACGNDQVDDTPPTKGHNPVGCSPGALFDTNCATGYVKHYTPAGGVGDSLVDYPDTTNSQNIMDYTYCQRMFTIGQCVRMRNALTATTAGRNNLITTANLAATGAVAPMPDLAPVADFSVERATGGGVATDYRTVFLSKTSGANFTFRNRSWNDTITNVSWIFSNSAVTPSSTAPSIVSNSFGTTGWVTTTLIASANSGSDTIVNTHAVYVADTATAGGLGYVQSFSTPSSIDNWPIFNYFENQYQWQYYTGASYDGDNACIRYRSRDTTNKQVATPLGDHDDLFTPAFNLTTGSTFYLNFKTAAATSSTSGFSGPVGDSLEIDASTNGGIRWTKLIGYKRGTLANNGLKTSEFVPTLPAQWVARGVQVPASYCTANTYFRFRYWPGNTGNNFYLDNVTLEGFPAGVADIATSNGTLKLMPNPANNGCQVLVNAGNDGMARVVIKDITGRVVFQSTQSATPGSEVRFDVSRSATPAAGIYVVTAIVDGAQSTEKLVVY